LKPIRSWQPQQFEVFGERLPQQQVLGIIREVVTAM